MTSIKGFLESSFIDWKGRVCAVLFLGGCNFRCPFCHNHPLVLSPGSIQSHSLDDILSRLATLRKWLGGVCVSGGEPTLDPGLPNLLALLKSDGWEVKLDTNGSNPEVLAELIEKRLIDMISMDVKAPFEKLKYDRCAGVAVDLERIQKSVSLIMASGVRHEFRMTVAPKFHAREDIIRWSSLFDKEAILTLQNFNPRTTLDPDMEREKGFPPEQFEEFKLLVKEAGRQERASIISS